VLLTRMSRSKSGAAEKVSVSKLPFFPGWSRVRLYAMGALWLVLCCGKGFWTPLGMWVLLSSVGSLSMARSVEVLLRGSVGHGLEGLGLLFTV
jgi:hypothetical protein